MNKAIIFGNLTAQPELKQLPDGTAVAKWTIATNRKWKDKDGNQQEEVEFHNLVAFGKQAETVAQYFDKGSKMLAEGRLKTSNWEDKETGKKMYRTEIILERFEFGGGNNSVNTTTKTESQSDATTVISDKEIAELPF